MKFYYENENDIVRYDIEDGYGTEYDKTGKIIFKGTFDNNFGYVDGEYIFGDKNSFVGKLSKKYWHYDKSIYYDISSGVLNICNNDNMFKFEIEHGMRLHKVKVYKMVKKNIANSDVYYYESNLIIEGIMESLKLTMSLFELDSDFEILEHVYFVKMKYYKNNKTMYDGEISSFTYNGLGKLYDDNENVIYDGMFYNGFILNKNKTYGIEYKVTTNEIQYVGQIAFLYDCFYGRCIPQYHGDGKIMLNKQIKLFEGEFELGYRRCGTEYYENGNIKYKGAWKKYKYDGGIKYYENGNIDVDGRECCYSILSGNVIKYDINKNIMYEINCIYGKSKCKVKGYKNGIISYEGDWLLTDTRINFYDYKLSGYPEGKGTSYNENGTKKYEGDWVNDRCSGKGILYYENGNKKYEGDWVNDKWSGKGIYYYQNGTKEYEGNWVNGRYSGKGIEYYENGNKKYEGDFLNGKPSGKGILYYETGTQRYEGNFLDNKFSGKGIEYYENGNKKYEGNWTNGKPSEKGTQYH